jgi:hypothetical protein
MLLARAPSEWRRAAPPLPPSRVRSWTRESVTGMQRRRRAPLGTLPIAPARRVANVRRRGVLLRFPGRPVDRLRDAAWDDLLAHAGDAWTCRDRDSLMALAVCLLRLARDVLPERTGPSGARCR